MMRHLLYLGGLLVTLNGFAQQSYTLYSPDSTLRIEINTKDKLSWKLYTGKELLTHTSSVDLELKGQKKLSDKLVVSSAKPSSANETVVVPVPYRRKMIIDKYNQLELIFKEPFSVQFRLYNNGMAYRIGTRFKDSIIIESENWNTTSARRKERLPFPALILFFKSRKGFRRDRNKAG